MLKKERSKMDKELLKVINKAKDYFKKKHYYDERYPQLVHRISESDYLDLKHKYSYGICCEVDGLIAEDIVADAMVEEEMKIVIYIDIASHIYDIEELQMFSNTYCSNLIVDDGTLYRSKTIFKQFCENHYLTLDEDSMNAVINSTSLNAFLTAMAKLRQSLTDYLSDTYDFSYGAYYVLQNRGYLLRTKAGKQI